MLNADICGNVLSKHLTLLVDAMNVICTCCLAKTGFPLTCYGFQHL